MFLKRFCAAAAVVGAVGAAGPVATALADTTPAPPPVGSPLLTFVPPKVGPITVSIGATIIGGKIISPGVHVVMPGASLPPISWTPPPFAWTLPH
jgi:hypothetical protein